MNNTDDCAGDEEQLTAPIKDYRALLAITRPLVIVKHTPLPWQSPIYRDQAISSEAGNCRAESALREGEFLRSHLPEPGRKDEELTTIKPSTQPGLNLRLRIYLGMS